MCSYVTLCGENFAQRRKARKGCGFPVFILCVFERCAFAKAVWVIFTLRLLLSFVPFVVKMARCRFLAETRRRRGYAHSMLVLCVLRLRFRRGWVVIHASPYVFLCDLMWFKFHAKYQHLFPENHKIRVQNP